MFLLFTPMREICSSFWVQPNVTNFIVSSRSLDGMEQPLPRNEKWLERVWHGRTSFAVEVAPKRRLSGLAHPPMRPLHGAWIEPDSIVDPLMLRMYQ